MAKVLIVNISDFLGQFGVLGAFNKNPRQMVFLPKPAFFLRDFKEAGWTIQGIGISELSQDEIFKNDNSIEVCQTFLESFPFMQSCSFIYRGSDDLITFKKREEPLKEDKDLDRKLEAELGRKNEEEDYLLRSAYKYLLIGAKIDKVLTWQSQTVTLCEDLEVKGFNDKLGAFSMPATKVLKRFTRNFSPKPEEVLTEDERSFYERKELPFMDRLNLEKSRTEQL